MTTDVFTRESATQTYIANGGADIDPALLGAEVCYSCSDGGKVATAEAPDVGGGCCGDYGDCAEWPNFSKEEEPLDAHGVTTTPPLGARGILEEAGELVYVDREATYGDPSETLTRVGRIWGALLDREPLSPDEVAVMMAGLKLARQVHTPKRDNLRDGAGYLELADRVLRG